MMLVKLLMVLSLLSRMNSDIYKEREEATDRMKQLSQITWPYIKQIIKNPEKISPEVFARCKYVDKYCWNKYLSIYVNLVQPTRYDVLPWIDKLPFDFKDREQIILYYKEYAKEALGIASFGPDWSDYRYATKLLIMDMLLQERSIDELIKLIDQMVENEIRYIEINGKTHNPEIKVIHLKKKKE